jgi:GntR family transcriptional regulator
MVIRVDPGLGEPLFQQLVAAVKRDVATGALRPGDRLPSVRDLARELVVNPNTIAKAYQALEAEGVTLSRRGAGTFVAERSVVLKSQERKRRFREAVEAALADAVHLGLTAEEVRGAFDAALRKFRFDGEEEQ